MKKITWITALFLTLALIMTGCPGEGDTEDNNNNNNNNHGGNGDFDLSVIFSATELSQGKATVTVGEDTVTFTVNGTELWGELVVPEGTYWNISSYSGFKFDYKTEHQSTVYLMMDDGSDGTVFVLNNWGDFTSTDGEWWEKDCPFTSLLRGWPDNGPATIDKTKIMKFMVGNGGSNDASTNRSFEIRNFVAY